MSEHRAAPLRGSPIIPRDSTGSIARPELSRATTNRRSATRSRRASFSPLEPAALASASPTSLLVGTADLLPSSMDRLDKETHERISRQAQEAASEASMAADEGSESESLAREMCAEMRRRLPRLRSLVDLAGIAERATGHPRTSSEAADALEAFISVSVSAFLYNDLLMAVLATSAPARADSVTS